MKYIDLHCDALTKEGVASVTAESLQEGKCALQCFAAFIDGTKGEGFARALSLCDKFEEMCKEEGLTPVRSDFFAGNAMLTVEGGEAIEGNLENLAVLCSRGVIMMTLTWNLPNEIGNCAERSPSWLPLEGELRRKGGEGVYYGLTPFGRACVERMCGMKMLADVSHGSDALVRETAEICRSFGMPLVASHSNARAVFPHARNLTDENIRLIARSGGVVGLCFVGKFLSEDRSAEGQRAALLAHAERIVNVGGEDVLSIGSDFDGAPQNPYIKSPAEMPKLLFDLETTFGARLAEKIAFRNALRVLSAALPSDR